MTKAKPRSLELCAIGLGQAGGNLAAEWHRRGYPALLFNTAQADFKALAHQKGLSIPQELQVYVGLSDRDGAGRDPEYGAACIQAHADTIRAAIEARAGGMDALLVCAGLGGGTGSAVPALLEVMKDVDVPVLAVVTVPAHAESGITKVNAVRAANALVSAPLHGRIFIDNARLVESFPDVDIVSYFPHVNERVLAPLDEINQLNLREDVWSIRSFDAEDMRKVLLSGGVLQTHTERLNSTEPLKAKELVDVVARAVDGGRHLASGLDLSQCAYLALVVTGTEAQLKKTPMSVFDAATAELKKRTAGGAVYDGVYITQKSDGPVMAYILAASLALPARVEDLLSEAQREGGDLMRKIQTEIPSLEVSPLEGLNLFRGPTAPLGQPPVRPATNPRAASIKEQVQRDIPEAVVAEVTAPVAPPEPKAVNRGPAPENHQPRVGTGQIYDDVSEIEATDFVDPTGKHKGKPKGPAPEAPVPERQRPSKGKQRGESMVKVGTGRWDGSDAEAELTSDVGVSDIEDLDALLASDAPPDAFTEEKTESEAALSPEQRAAAHEREAAGFEDDAEATEMVDDIKHQVPPPIQDVEEEEGASTVPTVQFREADMLLSSVLMASDQDQSSLQRVYQDLIDRFRQAPDKRGRERVARRIIGDAKADDVEKRALAVWSMVRLGERGFRRALSRAAQDENPEIAKLALAGLDALGL